MGTFRTIVMLLQSCPNCGWAEARRSPRRGALDILLRVLFLAPYRCRSCRVRFYRFPIAAHFEPTPRPVAADPPARISRSSVLILADDIPVRKLLRRILEKDGYEIHELTESARLGLELHARPVDLVIADLDLAAEETMRMLQPLLANPDRRLIVISSEPSGPDGVPGTCIVLEKPFGGATLLANVRNALRAAS